MEELQLRLSGWTAFSAVMLMLAGIFGIIDGLVAIFNDKAFIVTDDQVVWFDITAWGWFHLILGVIVLAAGWSIMSNATWGRVAGILAASVHAVVSLPFITVYPWWTILIIALDVIVIYGLMVPAQLEETSGPNTGMS